MAVVITVFVCVLAGMAAIVYIQAMRIEDIRRKTDIQIQSAQKTVRTLVELLQNPAPTTPPDKIIEAIGASLHKIVTGGMVEQAVQGENAPQIEEGTYYPDVEFDEWLGAEGIPTTPGWWSPPKNDESNENVN
jgi:hypothetical protein